MPAVTVKDELVDVARLFGEVDTVLTEALRRYVIDQCIRKIEEAADKIKSYERKYGYSYDTFSTKIQTDEAFLERVEQQNPLWEEDTMEWKYRVEEEREWTRRLEDILKK